MSYTRPDRRAIICAVAEGFRRVHRRLPNLGELAKLTGIPKSSIRYHVVRMEAEGLIRRHHSGQAVEVLSQSTPGTASEPRT
jgi:DNA-binding IclR family transcriptional regulator